MNTYKIPRKFTLRLAALALVACGAIGQAVAQNQNSSNKNNASSNNRSSQAHTTEVRVTRATNYLGADVTATDGRKVGDIGDYFYDISSSPHLKYVVVVTGGFLGYGGDARAVPAEAITTDGDSAKLNLSSADFWNVAVLPMDRARFLNNRRNTDQLARDFKLPNDNSSSNAQAQNSKQQSNETHLVSFSDLQNSDAYDREGRRIGRFVDTWVSLDQNRAPYVEISSPPVSPFEVTPRTRFAIPTKRLQLGQQETRGYRLNIGADELRETADPISDTDGVKLLQSGETGDAVIRVRVAQN